ncbi:hypothetical protein LINGRAHAP2_LOCUS28328 [Linum grandiflorum]
MREIVEGLLLASLGFGNPEDWSRVGFYNGDCYFLELLLSRPPSCHSCSAVSGTLQTPMDS